MRQRFTQIIKSNETTGIPIGTSSNNITMQDGSTLKDTVGDINLSRKGDIATQLKKHENSLTNINNQLGNYVQKNTTNNGYVEMTEKVITPNLNIKLSSDYFLQATGILKDTTNGTPNQYKIIINGGTSEPRDCIIINDRQDNTYSYLDLSSGITDYNFIQSLFPIEAPNLNESIRLITRTDLFRFMSKHASDKKTHLVTLGSDLCNKFIKGKTDTNFNEGYGFASVKKVNEGGETTEGTIIYLRGKADWKTERENDINPMEIEIENGVIKSGYEQYLSGASANIYITHIRHSNKTHEDNTGQKQKIYCSFATLTVPAPTLTLAFFNANLGLNNLINSN